MGEVRCHKCAWAGEEKDLVEEPGNLIFYDYVAINTLGMDVTRSNRLCPQCREVLRTHRLVNGMVFDK
jgi:hypothetical protein